MNIRPTEKPATPGIFERAELGGRRALFRRFIRWFNLTVLQQAIRPLMIVLFSAPQGDIVRLVSGADQERAGIDIESFLP
jgi:hypothetical protein